MGLGALLAAALIVATVVRTPSSPESHPVTGPIRLVLSLIEGETYEYAAHFSVDATLRTESSSQPILTDVSNDTIWRVLSVTSSGEATVELRAENQVGTYNGVPLGPHEPFVNTMVLTGQGKVLSGGQVLNAGLGLEVPGSGHVTPLLPDHAVRPGDSWTIRYEQSLPLDVGPQPYVAEATYTRNQTVGGVQAAVIETVITMPWDAFADSSTSGGVRPTSAGGPTAPATFVQAVWFDPFRGEVIKMSGTIRFELDRRVPEFLAGEAPTGAPAVFEGTLTIEVVRSRGVV